LFGINKQRIALASNPENDRTVASKESGCAQEKRHNSSSKKHVLIIFDLLENWQVLRWLASRSMPKPLAEKSSKTSMGECLQLPGFNSPRRNPRLRPAIEIHSQQQRG